jgi:hypothetical protein
MLQATFEARDFVNRLHSTNKHLSKFSWLYKMNVTHFVFTNCREKQKEKDRQELWRKLDQLKARYDTSTGNDLGKPEAWTTK